jgi:hypothetical protein
MVVLKTSSPPSYADWAQGLPEDHLDLDRRGAGLGLSQ